MNHQTWRKSIAAHLTALNLALSDLAEISELPEADLAAWIDNDSTAPPKAVAVGLSTMLARSATTGVPVEHRKLSQRQRTWPGRTWRDIGNEEGLTRQAVLSYAEKHGIELAATR